MNMNRAMLWANLWEPEVDGADALIIVPPFGELHYPALGVHVIQACAAATGKRVAVLYANLLFASAFGGDRYRRVAGAFRGSFLGERLFARAAYGVAPLGANSDIMFRHERLFGSAQAAAVYADADQDVGALIDDARRMEADIPAWIDHIARYVADRAIPVVGATTTFEQTAAAVGILRAVNALSPETTVILGGANCEGEMAGGVLEIAPFLDHVFSGECEQVFPEFLEQIGRGAKDLPIIIKGRPCERMDAIPPLNLDDYFDQRKAFKGNPADLGEAPSISYETSRGCWWGQKHHCTFCGLNGEGMGFRIKSPDKVITELQQLTARHGVLEVMMTDNIMPHTYFASFIPRLPAELPKVSIFYEQKANLSLERLSALKRAGVHMIQPGIEALSTDLLKLMRKGVSARQNLNLLRQARAVSISVIWNLLWGFPGDDLQAYQDTLALIKLIGHLQPPGGFWPVMIDRFSPYHTDPASFGISNVQPLAGYADFLPPSAPVNKLAYHFMGGVPSKSKVETQVLRDVQRAVATWRQSWAKERPPELRLGEHAGLFVLVDTRGLGAGEPVTVMEAEDACQCLTAQPFTGAAAQMSLVERKLAVKLDGWFQPLAVVDPPVWALLEEKGSDPLWAQTQTSAEPLSVSVS